MADYSIGADQVGVYEIPLTAGNVTTVAITNRYGSQVNRAQVGVHDASMPVYARLGNAVTVKDTKSQVIAPGTWLEIPTGQSGDTTTIALISAADATISVARA